mmetsp:Transcript_6010/g.11026  ORF Transcript_6010/g.11026 Transcript_6010/m.11026 type:complete len:693 (-) Transcript_6010:124-2202(-)|eukprot:CAMPEP_0197526588 /NCGR_PEP_ID=MMETSP1318-20131121/18351_1 /TAXON_ID=552666 /ORGANISM="Partenskyella glossopodia, Strain RCC365" /LENGTH=692 /DNA_ID=CAMNT_0043080813 /DNA_START=27 /DNA_END=2105 /DNA_ORIENTATION=-
MGTGHSSQTDNIIEKKSRYGARLDLLGILGVVQYIATHHREVESLFTHVESSVDYASQIDPHSLHDLRTAISNGDPMELNKILPECSPYLVAAALKMHFKEMEEPIVPFDYYNDFLSAGKELRQASDGKKMVRIKALVNQLPTVPKGTFEKLVRLLDSLETGESPYILACAFATSVFRPRFPPESTADMMEDPKIILNVLNFIVAHAKPIFPRPGDPEQLRLSGTMPNGPFVSPPQPPPPDRPKPSINLPAPPLPPQSPNITTPKEEPPPPPPPARAQAPPKPARAPPRPGRKPKSPGIKAKKLGNKAIKFPALKKRKKKFGTLQPSASIERIQAYQRREKMNENIRRMSETELPKPVKGPGFKIKKKKKKKIVAVRKDGLDPVSGSDSGVKCDNCGAVQQKGKFCSQCGNILKKPQPFKAKQQQDLKKKEQEAKKRQEEAKKKRLEEAKKRKVQQEREAAEAEARRQAENERQKRARVQAQAQAQREREERERKEREREERERQARLQAEKEAEEKRKAKEREIAAQRAKTKKPAAPKPKKKVLAAMWDRKAKEANEQQKHNVFSKNYNKSADKKLKRGQKGYGSAPEGSKSAARAERAKQWVKEQIGLLISVIKKVGTTGSHGRYEVTFGVMFVAYQDISDTLVGILRRAKKYKCVEFEGDMLFQGQSDRVVITLTPKADTWKHMPAAKA